jgi:hypothetical protein
VLIDKSSRDNTLLGVKPPGSIPRDAVSMKSSKDKRPKRSLGKTLAEEVSAISARSEARTYDLDAGEDRRIVEHLELSSC